MLSSGNSKVDKMDQVWQAIILGILQGITEFLPISSSAHLILVPWLAEWDSLGILFDVFLHAGTMLAIILYFRIEIVELFREAIALIRPGNKRGSSRPLLIPILILGTIPAGIAALIFRDMIEVYARTPVVTVVTLSVFGLVLWWVDRAGRKNKTFSQIGWKEGLLVGIAQAIALIPGVSRSGITITMALALGFSRKDSARFSFLLSLPILVLATCKGGLELLSQPEASPAGAISLTVGIITAFISGFLCIKFFLKYLEKKSFTPFVIYRLLLAAVILGFLMN
jgi:undecaprenyl-diphosphatase